MEKRITLLKETCEKAIAEGKVDFVGMARSWICNPNYGELLYEEKWDEIVPCIRCNKCHTYSLTPPFKSACSVNPAVSLAADWHKLPFENVSHKKIAVIGGGPAGMKASITAADRGHDVTIYEAGNVLGGQLCHSDYVSFKWPLRDFKNYLIRQVEKRSNIRVCLNKRVTPEYISKENYDVVFAGIGSVPMIPGIKGLKENGHSALDIYDCQETLGHQVVVVGGGEIGVETAMFLAQNGHEVTVLEMRDTLAADTNPVHYRSNFESAWEKTEHFKYILNAKVTEVTKDAVYYEDIQTQKKEKITADSIVIAAGMIAQKDQAMAYASAAPGFALIGDVADTSNNLLLSMQSAVFAANRF